MAEYPASKNLASDSPLTEGSVTPTSVTPASVDHKDDGRNAAELRDDKKEASTRKDDKQPDADSEPECCFEDPTWEDPAADCCYCDDHDGHFCQCSKHDRKICACPEHCPGHCKKHLKKCECMVCVNRKERSKLKRRFRCPNEPKSKPRRDRIPQPEPEYSSPLEKPGEIWGILSEITPEDVERFRERKANVQSGKKSKQSGSTAASDARTSGIPPKNEPTPHEAKSFSTAEKGVDDEEENTKAKGTKARARSEGLRHVRIITHNGDVIERNLDISKR